MKLFKKKESRKKILYQKFKNSQGIVRDEGKEKSKKRIDKKRYSSADKVHNLDHTFTIALCSIDGSIGSSYISSAIAYYIKYKMKKTVCIVDVKNIMQLTDEFDISIYPFKMLPELFDKYQYIILDCNQQKKLSREVLNEVRRANKKIMISLPDEKYEPLLADFIRNEKKINKWIFLFNLVPKSKKTYIYDLMEDYIYYCLESFDYCKPDKETDKVIKEIIKGK